MDEFRKAVDQAVIYCNVLNYVDRESEIAERAGDREGVAGETRLGRDLKYPHELQSDLIC
jgi:hypothetical protein